MRRSLFLLLLVSLVAAGAGLARAQQGHPMATNAAEYKFVTRSHLPDCQSVAHLRGNPRTEPSITFEKFAAGCKLPWHWHTVDTEVMMVHGVSLLELKGQKPVSLGPGGYAFVPARRVHRFSCAAPCQHFDYALGPRDLHYVDATGNEITPEAALKAVNEKPGLIPAAK